MMAESKLQPKMNGIIGELIQSASLAPAENFMTARTRRHAYTLSDQPEAEGRIKLHKTLCKDLIFGSSALQQIEFKGGHILQRTGASALRQLSGDASAKPAVLVPDEVHRAVLGAAE